MSESCKTSLRFIDGKPAPAFCMSDLCFEGKLYDNYGYTVIPKRDVTSITKQDLINHPEKFVPFAYSKSTDIEYVDEEFINYLKCTNGKWKYSSTDDWYVDEPGNNATYPEFVEFDVMYLERFYPHLYQQVLRNNNLPDTFSQIKKSGNKYNLPDLTVKKDSESTTNRECENVSPEASTRSVVSSNGKTHHAVPINITPEHVKVDELPEKITYVRKKVGDGFMFVVEDEQASKTTTKSESKNKPTETYARSVITESNAMKDSIDKIQQNSSSAGTANVITGKGQAHTINNPIPNFKAEDINLNDTLARIDAENDNAGIIMRSDGTKYIVTNNQVQPLLPIPQMTVPTQTAPQTQVSAAPTPIEAFDPAADPQLISVIGKLQGEGTFRVNLNTECGVTKVIVEDANGKIMDNLCFTVDLVGVCQTPDRKMWFGLPEIPDFAPSYAFNDAAINMIFTGEGEENLSPVFNAETCKLNRLVNLHSIFNIPGLDAATILSMMKVIKGIINKRSVKIELEKRDNMNVRFTIGNFKDPKNFRLILQNRTYLYNGGPLSNNKNKSFYIEVQNNQMKLYTGKKSKQQHITITPEQEEINKRITAILNEQISTKPSDIVNPNNQEEPNVVIEDLDPIPETVTA